MLQLLEEVLTLNVTDVAAIVKTTSEMQQQCQDALVELRSQHARSMEVSRVEFRAMISQVKALTEGAVTRSRK
eukprot:3939303-Rhodomonas_salina.2